MQRQSQENVIRDESGVYIQPSRRPDGSVRKAIRVKAGYVPQDEVPLYESKGKQFASRQAAVTLPVGLDPSHAKKTVNPNNPIPGLVILDGDAKKKKKKKKSEDSSGSNAKNTKSQSGKKPPAPSKEDLSSLSPEELEKRIKNLKKKVREINTLETKIESGEIKNPEKDQLEKLQRKPDLLSEIMALKLTLHGDNAEQVE